MRINDTNKIAGSDVLEKVLDIGRKIIPKKIFRFFQPAYHYLLAVLGAIIYRFPAKKMVIIGVTGTKGKSTTVELVNSILEAEGLKTAIASTIRYKIGDKEWRNLFKMTLRGRFFTQSFLYRAAKAGCSHAVIEVSSEGVPQYRHKFLYMDALIFTNLHPEHIESHGSYENYVNAKLSIAKELENCRERSLKKYLVEPQAWRGAARGFFEETSRGNCAIIANKDDKEAERFLALDIKNKIPYSLRDAIGVKADEKGSSFQIGKVVIHSKLPGIFNVYNMLGAAACARFLGLSEENIKKGLESIQTIRGRMEKIDEGQGFDAVVDYAHTPESLRAVYETYRPSLHTNRSGSTRKLICVLGNTGGGRDKWKRPEMGKIADEYCDHIILTNEDPYDEDPVKIVEEVKAGIKNKPVEIIMDRREAIRLALCKAKELASTPADPLTGKARASSGKHDVQNNIVVLITGKGTDPYIMEAGGKKTPWDDAEVVREELRKLRA